MKTIQQYLKSRHLRNASVKNAVGKTIMAIGIALVVSMSMNAQPGPPPPPPGGPLAGGPLAGGPLAGGPLPGGPMAGALQTVSTYQGRVVKLEANDDFVYDGFYFLYNSDSVLVHFPPHLGTQLVSVVKPGSTVSVSGVFNTGPMGEKEIRMLSINAGGKTIADTGAAINDTPPAENYVSGSGKVTQLQTGREGEVNGVIVDSRTIVRIPPHIARQLGNGLSVNAAISFTGMQKAAGNGESMAASYKVVHCRTITINGQQYMVE